MTRREDRVTGIFLAAGRSRRMGSDKLALPFRGGTIGGEALNAACESKLDRILVVTAGTSAPSWMPQGTPSEPGRVTMLPCMMADEGMSHSIRAGVIAAAAHGAQAVVVLLGDQPLLTSAAINRLLDEYANRKGADLVPPLYVAACREREGIPMPPILFDAAVFPALLMLTGDEGARKLLRGSNMPQGIRVGFREELFLDIDTPESYQDLMQRAELQALGESEPNISST